MDQSAEWLICNYCKKNFHGVDKLRSHKKDKHITQIRASLSKRKIRTFRETTINSVSIVNNSINRTRIEPRKVHVVPSTIPRKRPKLQDSSSDSSSSDELEYSKLGQEIFLPKSQRQPDLSKSKISIHQPIISPKKVTIPETKTKPKLSSSTTKVKVPEPTTKTQSSVKKIVNSNNVVAVEPRVFLPEPIVLLEPLIVKSAHSTGVPLTPPSSNHTPPPEPVQSALTKTPVIDKPPQPAKNKNIGVTSTLAAATTKTTNRPIDTVQPPTRDSLASELENETSSSTHSNHHNQRRQQRTSVEEDEFQLRTLELLQKSLDNQVLNESSNLRTQRELVSNSQLSTSIESSQIEQVTHVQSLQQQQQLESVLPPQPPRAYEHTSTGHLSEKAPDPTSPILINPGESVSFNSGPVNETPVIEFEPIIREQIKAFLEKNFQYRGQSYGPFLGQQQQQQQNQHHQQQQNQHHQQQQNQHHQQQQNQHHQQQLQQQQQHSFPRIPVTNNLINECRTQEQQISPKFPCDSCFRVFNTQKGLNCHSRIHKQPPPPPVMTRPIVIGPRVPEQNVSKMPPKVSVTIRERPVEKVNYNPPVVTTNVPATSIESSPSTATTTTTTSSGEKRVTKESVPQNFQCALCKLYFVTMLGMERHMKHHENIILKVAYGCSICKARFEVEEERNEHLKIHLPAQNEVRSVSSDTTATEKEVEKDIEVIELSPDPVETEVDSNVLNDDDAGEEEKSLDKQDESKMTESVRLKSSRTYKLENLSADMENHSSLEIIPIVTLVEETEGTSQNDVRTEKPKSPSPPPTTTTIQQDVTENEKDSAAASQTNSTIPEGMREESNDSDSGKAKSPSLIAEEEEEDVDKEPKEKLLCYICAQIFSNVRELYTHIFEDHTEKEKNFPCSLCPRTFDSTDALETHKKTSHVFINVQNRSEENKPKTIFACSTCRMGFHVETGLIIHHKITGHI